MSAPPRSSPVRARWSMVAAALAAMSVFALGGAEPVPSAAAGASTDGADGTARVATNSPAFGIEGDATRLLSPGAVAPLDLRLTNLGAVDVVLVRLTVAITAIHAPYATNASPCTATDFAIRQIGATDLTHILPSGSTRTLSSLRVPRSAWPAVSMLNRPVNQDGCQQATLTLHYTGTGRWLRK